MNKIEFERIIPQRDYFWSVFKSPTILKENYSGNDSVLLAPSSLFEELNCESNLLFAEFSPVITNETPLEMVNQFGLSKSQAVVYAQRYHGRRFPCKIKKSSKDIPTLSFSYMTGIITNTLFGTDRWFNESYLPSGITVVLNIPPYANRFL